MRHAMDRADDRSSMLVDDRFRTVAAKFFSYFAGATETGGGLVILRHGEPVVDIWAGAADGDRHWSSDTMAVSYSTGKGVVAVLLNRLIDRGLLELDQPVAAYWPEFAAAGKSSITVGEVLAHRAGLQGIRHLGLSADELLDHDRLAGALAAAAPDPLRRRASGYHGLTFGTLGAEIARRASGVAFDELIRTELAEPLGERDFYFGVPEIERGRIAALPRRHHIAGIPFDTLLAPVAPLRVSRSATSAIYPGWADSTMGARAYDTVMPSWNGVFTARSLATVYGVIAGEGAVADRRLLTVDTTRQITEMPPNSHWDYVLGAAPHWHRGFHRGLLGGRISRRVVAHFGLGGSGGLAIPHLGLAIGFVTNQLGNAANSIGDTRLPMLARLAARATQTPRVAAASSRIRRAAS